VVVVHVHYNAIAPKELVVGSAIAFISSSHMIVGHSIPQAL